MKNKIMVEVTCADGTYRIPLSVQYVHLMEKKSGDVMHLIEQVPDLHTLIDEQIATNCTGSSILPNTEHSVLYYEITDWWFN